MLRAGGPAAVIPVESNREAESRPRYPRQQPPTRYPLPESTKSFPVSTWNAEPRDQAAEGSASRPRNPPTANQLPAGPQANMDWQGGAASPPADTEITYRAQMPPAQSTRQDQQNRATAKVFSKEQLRPEDRPPDAKHSEGLAWQADVIEGREGWEVSETDRMWHPDPSELGLLQKQPARNEDAGRASDALPDTDRGEEAGTLAGVESPPVQSDLERCQDIRSSGVFALLLNSAPSSEAPVILLDERCHSRD